MNIVAITGRLGKPIELKYTGTGKAVTNFSLAVYDKQDTTFWFNCVAFDKTAELLHQYANKGDNLGVDGKLTEREYTKADGTKARVTEIIVHGITFLSPKKQSTENAPADRYDPNRQTQIPKTAKPVEPTPNPFTQEDYDGLQINPDDLPF